jgi:hypothetical protein
MKFNGITTLLPAWLICLLLTACAMDPRIHSLYDPGADFARFSTYNFAPEAKAGDEQYTSLLTKNLKYSISQEMESRGYSLSNNPDLLVNFKVKTREKIDMHATPVMRSSPFYSPYPYPYYYAYSFGFYDPWPYYAYETRVVQYTEGTLNIDLIEAAAKQLVWEGAAIGRVREDRENMPEYVREVVASIFERYPFVAGKGEPVNFESNEKAP